MLCCVYGDSDGVGRCCASRDHHSLSLVKSVLEVSRSQNPGACQRPCIPSQVASAKASPATSACSTVPDFIISDKIIQTTEKECNDMLTMVGFADKRQKQPIGSLSDGWKMKLVHVMLFKANILLLNKPTNHLDVINVAWLEAYLTGLTTSTSNIVSHDSGFLNNTITDILHLNRFKLRRYKGNLNRPVEAVPEARGHRRLEALTDYKFKFKFPDPPMLEGIKTKGKSLLKMRKTGYQYAVF